MIELLAIWGAIYFKNPTEDVSEKFIQQFKNTHEKTQFVEPETLQEKFDKSEKIDEFLDNLKKPNV